MNTQQLVQNLNNIKCEELEFTALWAIQQACANFLDRYELERELRSEPPRSDLDHD